MNMFWSFSVDVEGKFLKSKGVYCIILITTIFPIPILQSRLPTAYPNTYNLWQYTSGKSYFTLPTLTSQPDIRFFWAQHWIGATEVACPLMIKAPTHLGLAMPLFACICCRVYDGLVLWGEQLIIPASERQTILAKPHQADRANITKGQRNHLPARNGQKDNRNGIKMFSLFKIQNQPMQRVYDTPYWTDLGLK